MNMKCNNGLYGNVVKSPLFTRPGPGPVTYTGNEQKTPQLNHETEREMAALQN